MRDFCRPVKLTVPQELSWLSIIRRLRRSSLHEGLSPHAPTSSQRTSPSHPRTSLFPRGASSRPRLPSAKIHYSAEPREYYLDLHQDRRWLRSNHRVTDPRLAIRPDDPQASPVRFVCLEGGPLH